MSCRSQRRASHGTGKEEERMHLGEAASLRSGPPSYHLHVHSENAVRLRCGEEGKILLAWRGAWHFQKACRQHDVVHFVLDDLSRGVPSIMLCKRIHESVPLIARVPRFCDVEDEVSQAKSRSVKVGFPNTHS